MNSGKCMSILFLAMLLLFTSCKSQPSAKVSPAVLSGFCAPEQEVVQVKGLPPLYKWMLAPDLIAAHWLGAEVNGKELVEPLNVVIVDKCSKSAEEASKALSDALTSAGFPSRKGHSGGYYAFVNGRLYPQLPAEGNHAFSDEPFEMANNHGRVFGPIPGDGCFIFVAAFSRESIALRDKVKHRYDSFNRARDRLADCLDLKTSFKRNGFADLGNHLVGDAVHTTGDHDGQAVVLERSS